MDNAQRQFEQLIRDAGLVLIRESRHRIYRAPDGRKFTCGRDHRGGDPCLHRNWLASLRRFLAQGGQND